MLFVNFGNSSTVYNSTTLNKKLFEIFFKYGSVDINEVSNVDRRLESAKTSLAISTEPISSKIYIIFNVSMELKTNINVIEFLLLFLMKFSCSLKLLSKFYFYKTTKFCKF